MSATKVRKDAYKTILNRKGFEEWNAKYGVFYGPMAQSIYDEILYPITKSELTPEQIEDYINNGELPSISKKRKEVNIPVPSSSSSSSSRSTRRNTGTRGGSTKRKNNRKSKRKNNIKSKNKTQRRNRKTYRRRC